MVQLCCWVTCLYLGFTFPRLNNIKSEGKIFHKRSKIFQKSSLTVSVQFRFELALYCLNLELDLRFSSIISLNFELNFVFGSVQKVQVWALVLDWTLAALHVFHKCSILTETLDLSLHQSSVIMMTLHFVLCIPYQINLWSSGNWRHCVRATARLNLIRSSRRS